ncbi:hypothetical protein Tco_0618803, partial [Tanacetum coccineum]
SFKDGDGDGDTQPHKGVKASANSDVMYFFTSAQDGDPSQDDVRLCLDDDLKKAQDHSQRQAAMYSASVEDLETISCFLEDRDIRHEPKKITEPETDLLVIGKDTQSLSQYAKRQRLLVLGK